MIVLGIETSCDETSASIVKDGILVSNIVYTQNIHIKYGGVVPELASQEHLNEIVDVVELALKDSKIKISQIDGIAVTYGPGLMGSLLIGLNFAKAMSISLNIPFLGINHLEGHIFSNYINNSNILFPHLCCLVSGGHTQLWEITGFNNYNLLGQSVDDAAGEAFDKGAKILGLNYPGGPEIDKLSKKGDPEFIFFPRPKIKKSKYNFSFSGLKTALLYYCKKITEEQLKQNIHSIAASYQEAIIDCLFDRIKIALSNNKNFKQIYMAGGVAANSRFREKSISFKKLYNIDIIFPDIEYCTDNAAMIAMAGYYQIKEGKKSSISITPISNLKL
jgi:N6-L-threonylcarbamoyladenine synthase